MEEGAVEAAARLFLDAKELQPHDQIAQENELLAYQLLRDRNTALRLATQLREKFPNSARAWSVWLRESPDEPAALEKQIPLALANEPQICMAMAQRFMMEEQHGDAERFAKSAAEAWSNRSYPLWLLAQTILSSTAKGGGVDQRVGAKSNEAERLKEALAHFEQAAQIAQKEKRSDVQALAFLGASFAKEMLGEKIAAEKYVESAYSCAPDDVPVLINYSTLLRTRGNLAEAIELLRKANKRSADEQGAFLLAEGLSKRNDPGDLEEALELLNPIVATAAKQPGLREHAACGLLDVLNRLGRLDDAESLLSVPGAAFSRVASEAIRARLALLQKDVELARLRAKYAKDAVDDKTSGDEVRLVANLLNDLGQYSDALPFWRRIGFRTTINYDTQELINCAGRLGQDGLLLDLCAQLRESGIEDEQLLRLEIDLSQRYDVEKAIHLIEEYLGKHPGDRSVRLRLSLIGLQHGN